MPPRSALGYPDRRQVGSRTRQIASGTSPGALTALRWTMGPMADAPSHVELVGRDLPLARLDAALRRAAAGTRTTGLVAGVAGIGKTSLLRAATRGIAERAGWGTCVEGGAAPGYWPWTQAFSRLVGLIGVDRAAELAGADRPLLAAIAADLGPAEPGEDSPRARLLLMDATARWLRRLAAEAPVVIVLDDLQWADESSVALFDYLSADPADGRICLLGAYRDDELSGPLAERLGAVTGRSEHIQLSSLDRQAAAALVEAAARPPSLHAGAGAGRDRHESSHVHPTRRSRRPRTPARAPGR